MRIHDALCLRRLDRAAPCSCGGYPDEVERETTDVAYIPVPPREPAPLPPPPIEVAPVTPRARSIAELFQEMMWRSFRAGYVAGSDPHPKALPSRAAFEAWYAEEVLR